MQSRFECLLLDSQVLQLGADMAGNFHKKAALAEMLVFHCRTGAVSRNSQWQFQRLIPSRPCLGMFGGTGAPVLVCGKQGARNGKHQGAFLIDNLLVAVVALDSQSRTTAKL